VATTLDAVVLDQIGSGLGEAVRDLDGDLGVLRAVEEQRRHRQLVRSIDVVDGIEVETRAEPDEGSSDGQDRVADQPADRQGLTRTQPDGLPDVDVGGLEDQPADERCIALEHLAEHEAASHARPDEHHVGRSASDGVGDRGLDVGPLLLADEEQRAVARRRSRVVAVADHQRRVPEVMGGVDEPEELVPVRTSTVDRDDPGAAPTGEQPRLELPQRRGVGHHLDVQTQHRRVRGEGERVDVDDLGADRRWGADEHRERADLGVAGELASRPDLAVSGLPGHPHHRVPVGGAARLVRPSQGDIAPLDREDVRVELDRRGRLDPEGSDHLPRDVPADGRVEDRHQRDQRDDGSADPASAPPSAARPSRSSVVPGVCRTSQRRCPRHDPLPVSSLRSNAANACLV
jgi:hypothetical protein